MQEKPNYYAIIPAPVRYCKALPHGAKLLYGEITALSRCDYGCYARNKYFAELFNVDMRTIQNWVKLLEDNGFIERETAPAQVDKGYRSLRIKDMQTTTYKQESYEEIFSTCGISGEYKRLFFEFLKHCQINGKIVTNEKLYNIIIRLDMWYVNDDLSKMCSLKKAIDKGYFDVRETYE